MLTDKQRIVIMEAGKHAGEITKKQAVMVLKHFYYRNPEKYVGEILSRMVKAKMIERIKPGLFKITALRERHNNQERSQPELF